MRLSSTVRRIHWCRDPHHNGCDLRGVRGLTPGCARHRGTIVNSKQVTRLMREHDLHPERRLRCHNRQRSRQSNVPGSRARQDRRSPEPALGADTYIAITAGFVFLGRYPGSLVRRMVGYAIGHSIDVRLTIATLKAGHPSPAASERLHAPIVSRFAICL